jgi:hypothetical protein
MRPHPAANATVPVLSNITVSIEAISLAVTTALHDRSGASRAADGPKTASGVPAAILQAPAAIMTEIVATLLGVRSYARTAARRAECSILSSIYTAIPGCILSASIIRPDEP